MTGLTVYAFSQRSEANAQASRAEEQAEIADARPGLRVPLELQSPPTSPLKEPRSKPTLQDALKVMRSSRPSSGG